MSGGYTVRFLGGPAHGETCEVPELLRNIRILSYELHPFPVTPPETPYAPGVAVYTLTRTADGGGFYQHCYDEEPIK